MSEKLYFDCCSVSTICPSYTLKRNILQGLGRIAFAAHTSTLKAWQADYLCHYAITACYRYAHWTHTRERIDSMRVKIAAQQLQHRVVLCRSVATADVLLSRCSTAKRPLAAFVRNSGTSVARGCNTTPPPSTQHLGHFGRHSSDRLGLIPCLLRQGYSGGRRTNENTSAMPMKRVWWAAVAGAVLAAATTSTDEVTSLNILPLATPTTVVVLRYCTGVLLYRNGFRQSVLLRYSVLLRTFWSRLLYWRTIWPD